MVVLFFRYLFELLLIPIAAVISLLPAHRHLRYRAGRVYGFSACVLLLFCGLGSWLCARMSWTANAVLLPCLILFFLLYCLVVDYSIPKRLFCFFNAAMLTGFSTMFVFYLLPPFGMEQNIIVSSFSESLVTLGVALLLFLVFFRPLSRWLPELMDNPSLDRMWLNLQVVPILLTALVFLMTPQRFLPNALPDFILPELLLLIPVGTFALYGLLWRSSRELLESSRLRKEVDLLEMEKKRAESFQYYVENTRTMRHDFRQHLLVIDQLAKSGDNEKLLDYLGQFTVSLDDTPGVFCANRVVDAVAAHYDAIAKRQETVIQWRLELPDALPMSELDLCTIVGNLLENALNATAELPPEKRKVSAVIRMLSDAMLGLSVENPYTGTIHLGETGLPMPEKAGHGIGLASVSSTVNKYNGTLTFRTEGGIFAVNLLLFLHTDTKGA